MINDIRQYSLRYELWSFTSAEYETLFYKEYINEELMRFSQTNGDTFDISEVDISNSILVDASDGLIPEWLRNND
jgi:hypothetical protein